MHLQSLRIIEDVLEEEEKRAKAKWAKLSNTSICNLTEKQIKSLDRRTAKARERYFAVRDALSSFKACNVSLK